jgi:hypothetical protein
MGQIADYVIALLDEILNEPCEREKRYEWALGDKSAKTGRRAMLPFDAVWESRKLIAEIDEDQHRQSIPFWDKPARMTVSGVHRGQQRRIYDDRKREAARAAGYLVLEIPWPRRPPTSQRDRNADWQALVEMLAKVGATA